MGGEVKRLGKKAINPTTEVTYLHDGISMGGTAYSLLKFMRKTIQWHEASPVSDCVHFCTTEWKAYSKK